MKTKYIIVGVTILASAVGIAALVEKMNSEKQSFSSQVNKNETMDSLIQNYESITDYNTQVAVWMHIFKTCPRWKDYVREQFHEHGSDDGTIEGRYITEINWVINRANKPLDYIESCNN